MIKILLITFVFLSNLTHALTGLKSGDKVPSLNDLKTTEGRSVALKDKSTIAVLVFYRGSWCPYCVTQLKSIENEVMPKIKKGVKLFAISVDSLVKAKKMKRNFKFSFDIISDPKAISLQKFKIINKVGPGLVRKYKTSYGIDIEGDSGETHHMIAHPAVYIIKEGHIIFSEVHENYKQRTKNSKILEVLSQI